MRYLLVCSFLLSLFASCTNDSGKSINGITRFENFESKYVTARNVDVWLPKDYSADKKYPVLYMQDGQMLFHPDDCWNGQAWEIDSIAQSMIDKGNIRPTIIVGIWSHKPDRFNEYMPLDPLKSTSAEVQHRMYRKTNGEPKSNDYLRFLVKELKPFIDNKYSTLKGPENTFIGGSHLGGLLSVYAVCKFPTVFGGFMSMSTNWNAADRDLRQPVFDATLNYLAKKLPKPGTHKVYFDFGTIKWDRDTWAYQEKVDIKMVEMGYQHLKHYLTREFQGADATEPFWRARVNVPLQYLLVKED